jgi:hypothetical protein
MGYTLYPRPLRYSLIRLKSIKNIWCYGQIKPNNIEFFRLWYLCCILIILSILNSWLILFNSLIPKTTLFHLNIWINIQIRIDLSAFITDRFCSFCYYWINGIKSINYKFRHLFFLFLSRKRWNLSRKSVFTGAIIMKKRFRINLLNISLPWFYHFIIYFILIFCLILSWCYCSTICGVYFFELNILFLCKWRKLCFSKRTIYLIIYLFRKVIEKRFS